MGFFRAVASENERGTLHFLRYGANVNATTGSHTLDEPVPWHFSFTPLNVAANIGNDTMVKILLDHGAEINGVHPENLPWTPLTARSYTKPPCSRCAFVRACEYCQTFVGMGITHSKPAYLPGGLVNWALRTAQIPMLELLAEFGANFNTPIHENAIPLLQVATDSNISTDLVRFLLDHGADITLVDDENGILLNRVIKFGNINTARLLLERGTTCPPNILNSVISGCTFETIDLLAEYGIHLHNFNIGKVISAGRLDILQLLVDEGCDVNTRVWRGATPLHHAVRISQWLQSTLRGPRRFRRPVESFVRPVEITPQLNVSAPCSVWRESDNVAIEILHCLIKAGADINAVDERGRTPLDVACKWAPRIVQQLLVDNGADWEGGELPGTPHEFFDSDL
ncbi:ankyrin repeat-containing protein [Penicillium malachiteum]|uniref:ankyrin repeat-containing protein n=1 Tax=Penicillium malachiteum TaxID=1324776 RepID=UPI0025486B52|nr:ankyrin repeat-containing protein [Penicillium malachiteum]KAJ5735066.1 ankyrin repeat-containing protein [Penicillium malachiteum]